MKIGLLSDTHSYLDPRVFDFFKDCDEIWHAGDFGSLEVADRLSKFKPLRGVYGNIDGQTIRLQYPLVQRFECEGAFVYMTHIAGPFGKYSPALRKELKETLPNILVCGHSHILKVAFDAKHKLLYINPGAAGNHGFHKMKTLLRFEISDGKPGKMEVIELGLRGSLK